MAFGIQIDADGFVKATLDAPTLPAVYTIRGDDLDPIVRDQIERGLRRYVNGEWVPRVIRRRRIGQYEFLSRFTLAEDIALEQFAHTTDPEAATTAATVRVLFRRFQSAPIVDLDHAEVRQGLNEIARVLIGAGVWRDQAAADARVAEILA
jgi:hypothetical protein